MEVLTFVREKVENGVFQYFKKHRVPIVQL